MDTIRRVGLVDFSTNYFWPISDDQYMDFVNSTMKLFEEVVCCAEDTIFDLALTDYRFLFFLIQHAHYDAAFRSISRQKSSPLVPGNSLRNLVSPNWQSHVDYLSPENIRSGHFGNPRDSIYSKVGRPLRNYRDSIIYNLSNRKLDLVGLIHNTTHASIGPMGSMKHDFLCKQHHAVRVCEWNYFLSSLPQPTDTPVPKLNDQFLKPFLSDFRKLATKFGSIPQIASIETCWSQRFRILFGFYTSFLRSNKLPAELSISAAGNPIRKALGTASRRVGTKVFVFHHGECPGVERYPNAHRNDGSFPDFFVCPTEQIRKNFEKNYSESKIGKRSGVTYISFQSKHFEGMRRKYRIAPLSGSQNTVMLIGFGMNHHRYLDGAAYFYYFQLDIQYRLCLLIKRLGYKLIYKVHPDRASEVGSLFSSVADVVESRSFEVCWNNCSSYVFSHPGTTVFGHACFTKKPIVLVDLENNNWNEPGYSLLKRRCHTMSAKFNSINRILFDEAEFEEKLNNPLLLNDDYIDSYC